MYIVVHHDIKDEKTFFGAAESVVGNVPSDMKTMQFFPSADHKQAVCLWEAKSVDAVKSYLEPKTGKASKNTYYAVDSKSAMGLPVHA